MKITDDINVSINDVIQALKGHQLDFEFLQSSSLDMNHRFQLCVDSRRVGENTLFVALVGTQVDGHNFLEEAIQKNCKIAIVERRNASNKLSQVIVRSTREAWSAICRHFFDYPDLKLHLAGVTGTNGKTSSVWMIREILEHAGIRTACLGTLGYKFGSESIETNHTTPDPPILFSLMKRALVAGAKVFAMEVSSHSIAQKKIFGLRFSSLAFTSFSQDHLDFHSTLENYFETKLDLFRHFASDGCQIFLTRQVLSYRNPHLLNQRIVGRGGELFYPASVRQPLGSSMVIEMQTPDGVVSDIELPFFGEIFVDNFSCSLAIAQSVLKVHGLSAFKVLKGLKMKPVPGRMELVRCQKVGRPTVLVDYAHTPDALDSTIRTARALTRKKLTTVFGCGGERDKSKRPQMGKIASDLSDVTIVTDDNPRSEASKSIIGDILAGIVDHKSTCVIPDRHSAIHHAIQNKSTGDVILIAGKGHENYQIIGPTRNHFSDVDAAFAALNQNHVFLVLGAGVSGFAAARLLASQSDRVILIDDRPINIENSSLDNVEFYSSNNFEIGQHKIDALIKSPGISPDHQILVQAKAKGLPIISEIDLSLDRCSNPVVAVTGTNGKSTTTSMISHMLNHQGLPAIACGNIGVPPSELRASSNLHENQVLVCELSSYQLDDSDCLSPEVAIITSFSPDHLERHRSIENYFSAKWKVAQSLPENGLFILTSSVANYASKFQHKWPSTKVMIVEDQTQALTINSIEHTLVTFNSEKIIIGTEIIHSPILSKLCLADQLNAIMATLASGHISKKPYLESLSSLDDFVFLPHRNQTLGTLLNGSLVINDSKSTNLESTMFAVKSTSGPVVLLMGGVGKKERYFDINQFDEKISRYILFGKSADEIRNDIARVDKVSLHASFNEAVKEGFLLARNNKVTLLLSPACASFDEFKNFEHRGQVFQDHYQRELANEKKSRSKK